MKFVHLKAQALGIVAKAEEVVDKFANFCRRIGGNVKVEEDAQFYRVSCIFSGPKGLVTQLNDRDGLYISLAEKDEWFRVEPVSRSMSVTAYAYSPSEKIVTSGINLKFVERAKGGGITGKFTKMRLDVSKKYDEVSLWLGE